MSIESRKLELLESILRISNMEVTETIQSFVDEHEESIVAYTVDGQPLNQDAYKAQIKEAEKGKYLSHDEVKKAVDLW